MLSNFYFDNPCCYFPKVKKLDLYNKQITAQDIPSLLNFLNEHPEIRILDLTFNQIEADGAEMLASNTTLVSLNVCQNNICDRGTIALAANKTLKSLNVSFNHIENEGAKALAASTIKNIDVSHNKIMYEGGLALARKSNFSILNASHNSFCIEDVLDELNETDPRKRANQRRMFGKAAEVPSLLALSLFQVKKYLPQVDNNLLPLDLIERLVK